MKGELFLCVDEYEYNNFVLVFSAQKCYNIM